MRIWLVEVGESLPIDEGGRLMRTGLLAKQLTSQGHEVTWWADAFSHLRKSYRTTQNATVAAGPGLTLELLHAPPYARNISLARLRNQRIVAEQFRALAPMRPQPEVIYCGYPTIELAVEAMRFARARGIPVLLDIRDPWPQVFVDLLPRGLRWCGRIALQKYFHMGRAAIQEAAVLCAMSEECLQWGLEFAQRPRSAQDEVFYLAYEEPEGQSLEAAGLGRGPDVTLQCLYIGGFGPSYDLPTLIEAARLLQRQGMTGVRFVIAGDGPNAPALKRQAQGLPSVHFPGWVTSGQIRYLLSQSDVGVVAVSGLVRTAVPNKSFEYMSGGLLLLNSTTGDLRPLIESERIGCNYPTGNARQLAARIQDLLQRPDEVRKMKQRSRALFLKRFEAGTVYRAMADKLTALATQKLA